MNCIVTADGHEINVEHGLGIITARAIAHSLGQINRYNGHAARPYCVAEHSLLVVEIMQRECAPVQLSAHALFAGLMHDAHESIASDMHSPGKAVIGAAWSNWESRFESMVRTAFSMHTAATAYRDLVHKADLIALATERRDLVPANDELSPWPVLAGVEPVTWVDLRDRSRASLTWQDWRDQFLAVFNQLEYSRNELLARARLQHGNQ